MFNFNSEVGVVRTSIVDSAKYSDMSYTTYGVALMDILKRVTKAALVSGFLNRLQSVDADHHAADVCLCNMFKGVASQNKEIILQHV